jgi:3D (Asp-Asp-Asp) domain-containing protein
MYTKFKFSFRAIKRFVFQRNRISKFTAQGLAFLSLVSLIYHFAFPQYVWADFSLIEEPQYALAEIGDLAVLQSQALIQLSDPAVPVVVSSRLVIVTAYSSTPDQTDSSPFITASGSYVRDGIVAANFLRFGARVRFPEISGDKIFVVEDRMAPKNNHKMDIWFPSRGEAINFGVKRLKVEILQN